MHPSEKVVPTAQKSELATAAALARSAEAGR